MRVIVFLFLKISGFKCLLTISFIENVFSMGQMMVIHRSTLLLLFYYHEGYNYIVITHFLIPLKVKLIFSYIIKTASFNL